MIYWKNWTIYKNDVTVLFEVQKKTESKKPELTKTDKE